MGRALIALMVLGLAGAASAQGDASGREPAAGTVVLKVMTFNIKGFTADWFSREGRIRALIRSENPDIIALQEVMGVRRTHSFQASGLVDGYHYAFQGARKYSFFGPWMGNAILARGRIREVGSSRVDLQACKLEYSIVSPK